MAMPYLHCPSCDRTAWLDSTAAPPRHCRDCDSPLAPMAAQQVRILTAAVLERFERDMQVDAARPRFVRG
jgi:ribosomal protein L37AE/L43A